MRRAIILSLFFTLLPVYSMAASGTAGGMETPVKPSAPSQQEEDHFVAGKKYIFPSKVYLEKTSSGSSLQFDLLFKVQKACKPFLAIFTYLDKNGETILSRRLVNHAIEEMQRFTASFDAANRFNPSVSKFEPGDLAILTHPYGEQNLPYLEPAKVQCSLYVLDARQKLQKIDWEVPVSVYSPEVKLQLPFKGIWWNLQGHDTFSHHRRIFYHKNTNFFACDFMKTGKNGSICSGDGKKNEEYYSYGQPIFAAAEGVVVTVIDGVDENPVGSRAKTFSAADPSASGGNTVILKHGNGLFSYYGHLKKRSIKVKMGKKVTQGQLLGLCGNSGNSDAPHLHFHVADSPATNNLKGHGLPPVFSSFRLKTGSSWLTLIDRSPFAGEFLSR